MVERETPLAGGSHSNVVRVGETVRRIVRPCTPAIHDLLRHLEQVGFAGAPRLLGIDDEGREVLTYLEGDVEADVGSDDALVQLGTLIRTFHDAAATFPWAGREWPYEPRQPVETICHNELFPLNTVRRNGQPVAFIDWDTATPGPRVWDLGLAAWRWVPFWPDDKCRAVGLPTGTAEKARRLRLFVDAYGIELDVGVVHAGIERTEQFLGQQRQLAADGSEWEIDLAGRGVLDETAREISWVKAHAHALVRS